MYIRGYFSCGDIIFIMCRDSGGLKEYGEIVGKENGVGQWVEQGFVND